MADLIFRTEPLLTQERKAHLIPSLYFDSTAVYIMYMHTLWLHAAVQDSGEQTGRVDKGQCLRTTEFQPLLCYRLPT